MSKDWERPKNVISPVWNNGYQRYDLSIDEIIQKIIDSGYDLQKQPDIEDDYEIDVKTRLATEEEKTILDVFLKKASISDCIKHTDFGDVVCGSRELANSEDTFMRAAGGLKIVKNALKEINEDYDYIIMDTPPNCGAFMRNALFAANGIITPLQAKRFALDGLTDFLDTIELLKDDGNEQLEILGLLLTMYDQRNKQDKEIIAALPEVGEKLNINVFKTPIRINQAIENAIADSKSLFLTRSTSNGANDYADLIGEWAERSTLLFVHPPVQLLSGRKQNGVFMKKPIAQQVCL